MGSSEAGAGDVRGVLMVDFGRWRVDGGQAPAAARRLPAVGDGGGRPALAGHGQSGVEMLERDLQPLGSGLSQREAEHSAVLHQTAGMPPEPAPQPANWGV